MRALILILVFSASLSAQAIIGGSSGGGGASAANDLSDVTITSRASGDILVDNGSDVYVNEQILAAIGSRLTNNRVVYVASGVAATSANLQFDGYTMKGASGPLFKMNTAGTAGLPSISFAPSPNSGFFLESTNVWGFSSAGNKILTLGGSQTAKVEDQTATTGVTKFVVKANVAQGATTKLLEAQNSSGTALASVDASGYFKGNAYDLEDGGTKPTCDSTTRGYAWNDEGGAGVADVIERCVKDDDDAYYWKPELNDVVAVTLELEDAMVASTGDGKYYFFIDSNLDGYDLTDVELSNDVPGTTSGTLTIDLTRCTVGAAICSTLADMLSTSVSVDYDEFSSLTAASAVAINGSNNAVSAGQRIRIDVDAIAGGTAATDVKIVFEFTKRS